MGLLLACAVSAQDDPRIARFKTFFDTSVRGQWAKEEFSEARKVTVRFAQSVAQVGHVIGKHGRLHITHHHAVGLFGHNVQQLRTAGAAIDERPGPGEPWG